MSFKEVQTLDAAVTIALGGRNRATGKENPSSIEGYYLGRREVASRKSKTGLCFIHYFQTPKGNVGVWGKTDLDRKLGTVPVGAMTRAAHVGMQATPNGDMYKFKVEVDTDNKVEVAPFEATESEGSEENEQYGNDEDYGTEEETEAPLAAVKRNEGRDRVQALLSKNKKLG